MEEPIVFNNKMAVKIVVFILLQFHGDYDDYENDSVPEEVNHDDMGVSFKAWLARDPAQQLDTKDDWERRHGLRLWWERNFYPDVQMLANDLHAKGLVEAGEYIINIDW